MKIFFDTEFTGLHQNTTLISLGAVKDDNTSFYAEFGDFDHTQVNQWIWDNVISKLKFHPGDKGKGWCNCDIQIALGKTEAYGHREFIRECFVKWIGQETVEFWSDCLSYDWVLLNQLFSGALKIPKNWYYIPFDLCTFLKLIGINPDINREKFADIQGEISEKHNALWDAKIIKTCYNKAWEYHTEKI